MVATVQEEHAPGGEAAAGQRMQLVSEVMRYLERKDVKRVLYELTQALLVDQPEDPAAYLVDALSAGWPPNGISIAAGGGAAKRVETRLAAGGARRPNGHKDPTAEAVRACSAFLEAAHEGPRDAVERLLAAGAAATGGVLEFYSVPGGPGRRACRELRGAFTLVASSAAGAARGEAALEAHGARLREALVTGASGDGSAAAATVRSSAAVEGMLLLRPASGELSLPCNALALLPVLRLWGLVLGARLEGLAWRAKAETAQGAFAGAQLAIERLLDHGNRAAGADMGDAISNMLPQQLLRGGLVGLDGVALWLHNSFRDELAMQDEDQILSQACQAHLHAGRPLVAEAVRTGDIICVPDLFKDKRIQAPKAEQGGDQAQSMICVPIELIATTSSPKGMAVVQLTGTREAGVPPLDHFDFAGAEALQHSVLREVLRVRESILQLLQTERQYQALEQMLLDLGETVSVAEVVAVVEKSVPNVLDCDKCTLYFIDEEVNEIWAPPTGDLPEGIRVALGEGLAGHVAQLALEHPDTNGGVVISNDPRSCSRWRGQLRGGLFVHNLMTAPVWSGKKDKRLVSLIQVLNKHGPGCATSATEFCSCGFVLTADTRFCPRCGAEAAPQRPSSKVVEHPCRNKDSKTTSRAFTVGNLDERASDRDKYADFTSRDQALLEVLAKELGNGIQHLLLDMMWTKARMDQEVDEMQGPEAPSIVQEYYRELDSRRKTEVITCVEAVDFGRTVFAPRGATAARTSIAVMSSSGLSPTVLQFIEALAMAPATAAEEPVSGEAGALQPDVRSWEVNYWDLTETEEFHLLWQALHLCDVTSELHISAKVLYNFFLAVKRAYRPNPYHNFQHALSTLHYAIKILHATQLDQHLATTDILALVLGAFVHDVDHRGHNNIFEMVTRSELALRYNDSSPLENHHCARAFELAFSGSKEAERNVFRDLSSEAYSTVRKQMIAGILATDMKHHGQHVQLLQELELQPDKPARQCQFIVELLLHTADIGNALMPLDIASRWNTAIAHEFAAQAEDEERLGLPVTGFMVGLRDPAAAAKSQLGFIDFVLQPLATSLFRQFSGLSEPHEYLECNRHTALEEIQKGRGEEVKKVQRRARRTSLFGSGSLDKTP